MEQGFAWLVQVVEKFWDHLIFFIVIDEWERGVLLTWGKNPKELQPGLHFKFPFAQYVLTANVKTDTKEIQPIHVTIADKKTITVTPIIEFEIDDIIKFMVETNDAHTNLNDITAIVATDYLSDIKWEEAIKRTTWTDIKNKLNNQVKDMGVKVTRFGLRGICDSRIIITSI